MSNASENGEVRSRGNSSQSNSNMTSRIRVSPRDSPGETRDSNQPPSTNPTPGATRPARPTPPNTSNRQSVANGASPNANNSSSSVGMCIHFIFLTTL